MSENEDRSVGIYGQRRTSQRVASAVFRLMLQSGNATRDRSSHLAVTMPAIRTSLKTKSGSRKLKGSKTVGHVNNVADLRENSASYSVKMSNSLSGESMASELRKVQEDINLS